MADIVYTGAADVSTEDTRYVKWVGKTKGGQALKIVLEKAFCRSNPDWKFEEKNDSLAELEFEGMYTDENLEADDLTEPWKMTTPDGQTVNAAAVVLGVGRFYVGKTEADAVKVGVTRGGGGFVVERTYREINGDDDPGLVEGRIHKSEARPKLKFTALQWLPNVSVLYPGIVTVTPAAANPTE